VNAVTDVPDGFKNRAAGLQVRLSEREQKIVERLSKTNDANANND